MGTVWLARMAGKLGFERLVALKTILPSFTGDRRFSDMFLDEARIAARIDHENVARILDIGEDRSALYYAMELIDGHSVRKLHRDTKAAGAPFPMNVALRIIADACGGLHATHELRDDHGVPLEVVHRDVSPQNLLVSVRGSTKLIDFGVAKARSRQTEETAAGTLKGKLEYMAPEQARAEALDRRADVYSMGAVLYELLCGRPLRDTREGRQLVALHELMTGVPPAPLPPTVPPAIRAVVDKATARDAHERFPSADALRLAIERAMAETGLTASVGDVAAMLARFSHARTASRKRLVERALRAAAEGRVGQAAGATSSSQPSYGSYPSATGSPLISVPASSDGSATGPSTRTIGPDAMTPSPAPPAPIGRVTAIVAALGGLLVLGLIGLVLIFRFWSAPAELSAPAGPALASAPAPRLAPAAGSPSAEVVTVDLEDEVEPTGAIFSATVTSTPDAGTAATRPTPPPALSPTPSPTASPVTPRARPRASSPTDEYGF